MPSTETFRHQPRYRAVRSNVVRPPVGYASRMIDQINDADDGVAAGYRRSANLLDQRGDNWAAERLHSIADYLDQRGSISDKQRTFAESLVSRLATQAPAARMTHDLGDFSSMVAIFRRAAAALKHPKIALYADGYGEIELSLAGSNSKAPGTLDVKTPGGYGQSTWFGRILTDGRFQVSPRETTPPEVLGTLRTFADRPLETVQAYGRLKGRCALCNRPLKDAKSISMGVGPVCAQRYFG